MRVVEAVSTGAWVRYGVREAARRAMHAPGRAGYRRRLAKLRIGLGDGLRVNYGWIADPARPEEAAIGGGVKLAHLRERFGEARDDFNVLYLVSSVLHLIPHAAELVAHAKANGAVFVWNQNGVAYPAWCGEFYPWFNEPMRKLIGRADFVFYQSEFCRRSADRYLGAVNVPHEILWNPVDLERFSPTSVPLDGTEWRLLAMGTSHAFYRTKASIDCLAELVRRGKPARLTIAGELRWRDGDEQVRAYLQERGVAGRVEVLPRFTQAEAPGIYRRAQVLLHPKYKDPCPTVPIEAMACGVSVVGSRSGGMPELIAGGAGELVDVPDDWTRDHGPLPVAMADAVERIMAGWPAGSLATRRHAEASFGKRAWVERHEAVFRDLFGGGLLTSSPTV